MQHLFITHLWFSSSSMYDATCHLLCSCIVKMSTMDYFLPHTTLKKKIVFQVSRNKDGKKPRRLIVHKSQKSLRFIVVCLKTLQIN
jgi:acyl-CoA thioesterase